LNLLFASSACGEQKLLASRLTIVFSSLLDLDRASRTENAQAFDFLGQLTAGGRGYWLQLTSRSWNALCWMVVGLVTTVSGWLGVIAVVMVLRATVARSASSDWKLWTGSPSGVSPVVCY
jgi:hypothetical protein